MNILLYVPYVDKSFGGVLQYSKCLLSILQHDKKNKYILFLRNNFTEFAEFKSSENFIVLKEHETNYRTSLFSFFELMLFNFLAFLEKNEIFIPVTRPNVVKKVIKKYKIDVLHSPYQHMPHVKIPTLVTLHDLQELHFPDFFTPEVRAKRATEFLYITKNATKIIVSYNHIKQDIIKYYNVEASKIEVILLNMQNLWFDKFVKNDIEIIGATVALPQKFVLYPAATWRHKNHINLLKALKIIKEKNGSCINLVCTGHQTEYFKELQKTCLEMDLAGQVFFLGKVSEEDLYCIYKKCSAIVIPTLYEAGSFPLMEGMLMGIPCICSDVTSLPETLDQPSYLFDPTQSRRYGRQNSPHNF
jgi:glycosyltransferase involved in cell wall biosynthesis